MHYFGVPKLWNISIGPKMMFGSVLEYFTNLRQVKRCKTCVSGLNALFRGTEVVKLPFYSIGPKMMFGSVSEHFTNLRQVKSAKLVFRTWMHYFRVPKCSNISIRPKMLFGSVSEYFTNLRQVTRCKTCVPSLNALFRGTKVVRHFHWTQNDVWECFGVFH
jgi:acid stress-induced BolA-like protein IbaG/YrbA